MSVWLVVVGLFIVVPVWGWSLYQIWKLLDRIDAELTAALGLTTEDNDGN